MHVLYMATNGVADPAKASIPWHLAVNGTIEVGHTATIVLLGDATEFVKSAVRSTLEGVGLPPLRDLVLKARERGVALHV